VDVWQADCLAEYLADQMNRRLVELLMHPIKRSKLAACEKNTRGDLQNWIGKNLGGKGEKPRDHLIRWKEKDTSNNINVHWQPPVADHWSPPPYS
jgi:hypothetical protein